MLRYYEKEGLLHPMRSANGYRDYSENDVERAKLIRDLVRSGVPTRLIPAVLDQRDGLQGRWTRNCDQIFADLLGNEIEDLDNRIACLTRSRNALGELQRFSRSQLASEPANA